MADFDPSADQTGAANFGNFLSKQDLEVRKTNAYNALAKVYGPMAGDPEAATAAASAEVDMANAPNVIAANKAKADALTQSLQDFGPQAGNPQAQTQNLSNQDTQETNARQAQVRAIKMLQASVPDGSDSVDPATFDKVVGANAKTLGLTDPDQLNHFKAAVTAPGGAQHLTGIANALMAPQSAVGAPIVASDGKGGSMLLSRTKDGQVIQQPLSPGVTPVAQERIPIAQQNANNGTLNANTNRAKLPILQQNANTAAYSANTRTNNSNNGNPAGFLPGDNRASADFGGGNTLPKPSVDLIHAGNPDGTATTPTFNRLAPVGSKARSNAIGAATSIVNQDTTLQNANQVFAQALKQVPAGAGPSSLIKSLPGSAQADLAANLGTIKSQEQMAWIASLKNASGQTGIGRVLQSEAKNAESLFGNLGQEQTVGQLKLHLQLAQQAINQLHNTAQSAFKAQWGQDPYALLGQTPGKGGSGGQPGPQDAATKAAYSKYGIN